MSSVRKHYSTDLKVKIVLEILKEEKSVTQLASATTRSTIPSF